MGHQEHWGCGEVVKLSRRDLLRALAAAPLSAAGACSCAHDYAKPRLPLPSDRSDMAIEPILKPAGPMLRAAGRVIDTHAHFFNASDVPVRGFIAECLGHNAPPSVQPLLKALAPLADKLAERAPTAFDELNSLQALSSTVRHRSGEDVRAGVARWFEQERGEAADRVVDVVRGSEFERLYQERVSRGSRSGPGISAREVLNVTEEARQRNTTRSRDRSADDPRAAEAKAKLEFLFYMLSKRAANVRAYIDAFAPVDGSFGVDTVLGSLVDLDYWLDCPPRSAHSDQIAVLQHLAAMHGGYLQPVVAYNPWTDIQLNGAGLQRVLDAWNTNAFVAVKIYPPTGFMPAANASSAASTGKRRPDLKQLDDTLKNFFAACAREGIPVLAHAARSNGRDAAHDDFSSPNAWDALLCRVTGELKRPTLSLGHFGGDHPMTDWTARFANLMAVYTNVRLYGDLGYWDQLLCEDTTTCNQAKTRLKNVLDTKIGSTETVADRVMFATDWLMLSQMSGWRDYPQKVREALEAIAPEHVGKILGGNARKCFERIPA